MYRRYYHSNAGGRILDTLAQKASKNTPPCPQTRPVTVKGAGAEAIDQEKLQNRAKKKMITQRLTLALIDVATKLGETDSVQSYWNTYHCQSRIVSAGGRTYGNYCKNRFCSICSGIRKAEKINTYLPVIKTWVDAHFVTLTARSIPANKLKSRMDRMMRSIKKLIRRNAQRARRDKGLKLVGIRSLECNFNPKQRTYNPHFHFIVATKEMAELLIDEWLEQSTSQYALRKGQHSSKVANTEKALIEVIKYGTKVFTDPTVPKKNSGKPPKVKVTPRVYVSAFHRIITAMAGHRQFDRFGFNLPPGATTAKTITVLNNYQQLVFDPQINDWMDESTQELISGYKCDRTLVDILTNRMDMGTV